MPNLNGVDAARQIIKNNPVQRILVLTDVNSEQVIRDCLETGVRGWIFKSDGIDDLTSTVERLQRRNTAFNAGVSNLILHGYLRQQVNPTVPSLSTREREVLQLISEGKVTKEISATLHVSVKTAETHRSNMMRKLDLHSVAELVMYAVRNEIVHVERPDVLRFSEPKTNERATLLRSVN